MVWLFAATTSTPGHPHRLVLAPFRNSVLVVTMQDILYYRQTNSSPCPFAIGICWMMRTFLSLPCSFKLRRRFFPGRILPLRIWSDSRRSLRLGGRRRRSIIRNCIHKLIVSVSEVVRSRQSCLFSSHPKALVSLETSVHFVFLLADSRL